MKSNRQVINEAFEKDNEWFVFLHKKRIRYYTTINARQNIEAMRYQQSKVFKRGEDTMEIRPVREEKIEDDYDLIKILCSALALPHTMPKLVRDRFVQEQSPYPFDDAFNMPVSEPVRYHALHDWMVDSGAGIRIKRDEFGKYTVQLVNNLSDNNNDYYNLHGISGSSDYLDKALIILMQETNMQNLKHDRMMLNYTLNHNTPKDSEQIERIKLAIKTLDRQISILKKQNYFTRMFPEKNFNMGEEENEKQ